MTSEREAAFAEMFRRHYPVVRAYVYRRAWPDAVDDLLAQTFMTAWRRQEDIPADQLPWLLSTARGCIANHRRASARGAALLERLRAEPATAVDPFRQSQQRHALIDALGQLSESEMELVLLSEWEGLGPSEAGRLLGLGPARARTRLSRARRRLRAALDEQASEQHTAVRTPSEECT